jgi:hypothetical protein
MQKSSAATRRQAFKVRQAWIDDLHRRPEITLCQKLVGTRLALHQNLTTGACFPSVTTLSDETGIPERSIYRAIGGLKRHGRIKVKSGGRGRANSYILAPPTPDKASGVTPDISSADIMSGKQEEASKDLFQRSSEVGRESASFGSFLSPERTHAPEGASAQVEASASALPAEPPEEENLQAEPPHPTATPDPAEPPENLARVGQAEPSESLSAEASREQERIQSVWRELRALWQRPWLETPQEVGVAFGLLVKAMRDGIDAETIVDSAQTWVAAVEPRFLSPLGKWLAARGWESVPPTKKKRRRVAEPMAADVDDDARIDFGIPTTTALSTYVAAPRYRQRELSVAEAFLRAGRKG